MKTESENPREMSATSPSATMIERIAISTGTTPATTAPKTRTRTISAAGRPNASSPVSRSFCDCWPKSWFAVWSPVMPTWKAPPFAFSTTCSTGAAPESLLIATEASTAWPSGETATLRISSTWPVAWRSASSRFANAWNCGESTV